MERVAVIDYGMGNLRSVAKALQHVAHDGQEILVTSDRTTIGCADRVVFPGQGAMRDCMAELIRLDLCAPILEAVRTRPVLGICMGLQVLLESSEEDAATPGLAVFAGGVRRFPSNARYPESGELLKIPHMGWNNVLQAVDHPLWNGIEPGQRFYFVHSYYVDPKDQSIVTGTASYGLEFVCAIARKNLFAVQFHPEKSQRAGLTLLHNFLRWNPSG